MFTKEQVTDKRRVKKLKPGDEVMWSHVWGTSPWKKARVHMIAK